MQNTVVNVFSIPYPPHVLTNGTEIIYFATIPESIAIMAGYLVVSLMLGYLIFKRRDLT
jgi:ABC-type transport system involved in multi-copper enzyme maturation permease subunit